MTTVPVPATDVRSLRLCAPGADDSQRSPDEIRIIKQMTSEEVELFLRTNGIDDAAARELRNEPPYVALAVIERGPLRACVNPSGALVARIRDAKRGILSGGAGRYGGVPMPMPLDPNASELDKFLAENRIDQAGIISLRSEPPEVQKAVMSRGPLLNSTNPSASLMARIRYVKQEAQLGGGALTSLGSQPPRALEAPPLAPPPPAPFALDDQQRSGAAATVAKVDDGHLAGEALKAIQKLNGAAAAQSMQASLVPPMPMTRDPRESTMFAITNSDDALLQEEALKAMQQIASPY